MTYQPSGSVTPPPSEEPLYNIGVVSRLSGIPVATLRVWERRYGFPESARTGGGHRLYSEHEILRLRWVKARIDEGMQTGRAIGALHHLEQSDGLLPGAPLAGVTGQAPRSVRVAPVVPADGSLATAGARLTAAFLDHDLETANQIIADALAVHPLEKLLTDLLPPTLIAVGQAWHDGEISVATEHLATNFVRNQLLTWLATGPTAYDVPPVVLACAPNEWHEITLLIFGVLLRRQRWPVAYLGQAVPLPDLGAFIRETRPDAVVLVAVTDESAVELARWPEILPDVWRAGAPQVYFAGGIFTREPEWQARVPGTYLGDTIQAGVTLLDRALRQRYQIQAPGL